MLRDRGSDVVGRDVVWKVGKLRTGRRARPTAGKRGGEWEGRKNKKKRTWEREDGRVEKKLLRERRWGEECGGGVGALGHRHDRST